MSLFKPFSKIQIWIMGVLFFVFGTAHLKALANVENLWSARIPISLEGTIRPIEIIREQTSVGGRITAITVEENDEVQKNQLLLSLKNDTQKQQLELAQLQQKINQNNLRDYNSNFLRKINLKFVVLCKNLEISSINTGGIPDNKFRTLILDLTFNRNYFERMIHHEIFHMIDNSFPELFKKNKWSELNNKDFFYASCSTCTDLLGLDLEITKGFLTEYSMSTAEEDMAEIYSCLLYTSDAADE